MPGPSSSCILRPKPDPVCGYRIMRSGTDWEDVGERMRVARLAASLTQEELSARAVSEPGSFSTQENSSSLSGTG